MLVNDASASPATASLLTSTTHGSLQLQTNGTFTYTPTAGFAGVDSFTYRATSGSLTDDATATIYVVPVSVGPTSTTLNLLSLTAEQQVASMYLAFFGRAPDPGGFTFWVDQFITGAQQGQTPAQLFANIANSFAVSAEAKALYPLFVNPSNSTDAQISDFVGAVFNNLYNRFPDAGGSAYWTQQVKNAIAAGQSVGQMLVNFISGAQNTGVGQDITTLLSKIAVGLEYVHEQIAHGTSWSLSANGAEAVLLVAQVTNQPLTVLSGTANAENVVAPPSAGSAALTSEDVVDGGPAFIAGNDNGSSGVTSVVQPGDTLQQAFDMGQGDQLDLTQVLAGAALQADLTNIADFVKVIGYGPNDAGFGAGTKTMLEIVGPNGNASVTLEGAGNLTVNDLLRNNSLVLPPH